MTNFSNAIVVNADPAATAAVWVLAADDDVLVCFDDWQVVRGLYRFVRGLQDASRDARRQGDFRVMGASVEVDSPAVRAWRVSSDDIPAAAGDCGIGDGTLLLAAEAEAITLVAGSELAMVILKIFDDGMLIVEDGDALEATIDLSNLVAAGRHQ